MDCPVPSENLAWLDSPVLDDLAWPQEPAAKRDHVWSIDILIGTVEIYGLLKSKLHSIYDGHKANKYQSASTAECHQP